LIRILTAWPGLLATAVVLPALTAARDLPAALPVLTAAVSLPGLLTGARGLLLRRLLQGLGRLGRLAQLLPQRSVITRRLRRLLEILRCLLIVALRQRLFRLLEQLLYVLRYLLVMGVTGTLYTLQIIPQ
jgi:hypothetical protein